MSGLAVRLAVFHVKSHELMFNVSSNVVLSYHVICQHACLFCTEFSLAHPRPPFSLKPSPKPGFDQHCIPLVKQVRPDDSFSVSGPAVKLVFLKLPPPPCAVLLVSDMNAVVQFIFRGRHCHSLECTIFFCEIVSEVEPDFSFCWTRDHADAFCSCDFVLSWNRNFACIARENYSTCFCGNCFNLNLQFCFTDGKLFNQWMLPNFAGSNQANH